VGNIREKIKIKGTFFYLKGNVASTEEIVEYKLETSLIYIHLFSIVL